MALLKNLSLMAATTALRLVAGVVALGITGRALGPTEFGVLMFWMSVGGLLCVFGNFGLGVFLLREIGRDRESAPLLISQTLTAKLILCAGLLSVAILFLPMLAGEERIIYLLLLTALLVEGFSEYVAVGFRARDRFDVDSKVAVLSTIINCSTVAAVAWWTKSALWVAFAYVGSRALVLLIAWHFLVQVFGRVSPSPIRDGLRTLRGTVSYALDTATGALFGQVDSIVLNHFVGPTAVGIYQAGMRFFMAGIQSATVLTNVFVPRAAHAHKNESASYSREKWRLQAVFLGVGCAGGALLAAGGPKLVNLFFGSQYSTLAELMPFFGLLFVLKFACAAWGIVLMIQGEQRYRAIASALHWLLVFAVAWFAVPKYESLGWLVSLLIGNGVLLLLYIYRTCRMQSGNAGMIAITVASVAALAPFVRF